MEISNRVSKGVTQPLEVEKRPLNSLSKCVLCVQETMEGKDKPHRNGFPRSHLSYPTYQLILGHSSDFCPAGNEVQEGINLPKTRPIIPVFLIGRFLKPRYALVTAFRVLQASKVTLSFQVADQDVCGQHHIVRQLVRFNILAELMTHILRAALIHIEESYLVQIVNFSGELRLKLFFQVAHKGDYRFD